MKADSHSYEIQNLTYDVIISDRPYKTPYAETVGVASANRLFTDDITVYNLVYLLQASYFNKNREDLWQRLKKNPGYGITFILIADEDVNELHPLPEDMLFTELNMNASEKTIERVIKNAFRHLHQQFEILRLQKSLTLSTEDLHRITHVGQSMSKEHDFDKLIDMILLKAREVSSSDGGSIYLTEKPADGGRPENIRFIKSVLDLDADEFLLPINSHSIAGYVALTGETLLIDDVRQLPEDVDYSFNPEFDRSHGYYTKSMMVIPMTNNTGEIIGVLQLINRKRSFGKKLTLEEMKGDEVISFSEHDFELVASLAGQAAVAIENQRLLKEQRDLLESFIRLIAAAIDSKSPYTGAHCERVPVLTEMLTRAACESDDDQFKDFDLSEQEWYEVRIAAWLHDCGKVVTPTHVMDKATKLETIHDRIEGVRARFEILIRDTEIDYLKKLRDGYPPEQAEKEYKERVRELKDMRDFIQTVNLGAEFLEPEKIAQIKRIGQLKLQMSGQTVNLLSKDEIENLSVSRGTLTDEERLIINAHMVETIQMLEALPFPQYLRRVPEIAGGHHEKMDGTGYPKGIYAGDMSLPARIMAIADVFEALTAQDRPYKKGKTLSETMEIMGKMKKFNHLDPDLFNLFVKSGVYSEYGRKYLPPELIDEVNEEELLSIEPEPYELPPEEERNRRWEDFLPKYRSKKHKKITQIGGMPG